MSNDVTDTDAARQFLSAVFYDLKNTEYIELRLIDSARNARSYFVRSIDAACEAIGQTGADVNVYVGISPRAEKSGTKDSIRRMPTLWADIDAKQFADGMVGAENATKGFIMPPSIVINSGGGYHLYWLLDESIAPSDGEELLKGIKGHVQGDSVCDCTRIMRVPGTWNVKYDPPIRCAITRIKPDLRYSPKDINAGIHISDRSRQMILTGVKTGKGDKSRSGRDMSAIRELKRLGISDDRIKSMWQELPIGDKLQETGGPDGNYIERTLKNATDSAETGKPSTRFLEVDDCYIVQGKRGPTVVSTFIIVPERVMEGKREDILQCSIHANGQVWNNIHIPRSAFVRRDALMRHMTNANWQWVGGDSDVRFLLPYLLDKLNKNGAIQSRGEYQIGRYDDMWLCRDSVITRSDTIEADKAPLVFIDTSKNAPDIDYPCVDEETYTELIHNLFPAVTEINTASVMWPTLGWFMACPYKTLLEESGIRFPVLNLFGTRGSGKTSTLTRIMQPMFGYRNGRTYDCSTTQFVLLSLLGTTNSLPVALSEFRRSSMTDTAYNRVLRTILLAYDHGFDARGKSDQTTETYPLSAPFSVDGEDSISDAACKERSVIVNLKPESVAEGTDAWHTFRKVSALPLSQFGGPYIRFTLHQTVAGVAAKWNELYNITTEAFDFVIPDRVRRNITTTLLGVWSVGAFVDQFGVSLPEITPQFVEQAFGPSLDLVVDRHTGRTTLVVDEMIADIVNAVAMQESTTVLPVMYKYDSTANILWVHVGTLLSWWLRKRHTEHLPVLDRAAIKQQLSERNIDAYEIPGQYIVGERLVRIDSGTVQRCIGISLDACMDCGLDITERLDTNSIKVVMNVRKKAS